MIQRRSLLPCNVATSNAASFCNSMSSLGKPHPTPTKRQTETGIPMPASIFRRRWLSLAERHKHRHRQALKMETDAKVSKCKAAALSSEEVPDFETRAIFDSRSQLLRLDFCQRAMAGDSGKNQWTEMTDRVSSSLFLTRLEPLMMCTKLCRKRQIQPSLKRARKSQMSSQL